MFQKIIRFDDGRFPHFPVFGETFQKVAKKLGCYYQYTPTKTDEFSKKFRTAPPPHFEHLCCGFF